MLKLIYQILSMFNDIYAISGGSYGKRYMRKTAYRSISKWLK